MTNLEAIKHLQEQVDLLHKAFGDETNHTEPYKLAIEALEKQVPKKPVNVEKRIHSVYYTLRGNCPDCGDSVFGSNKYCDKCGQHLNWSEVE